MLPKSIYAPLFSRLAGSAALRGLLLLGLVLLVTQTPGLAQGSGPSPAATMNTVKDFALVFLRGLMAIGLIIALLKVAKNFLTGSPESLTSFLWLVGGLVIFFGWGFFFRSQLGTWSAPSPATGNIGNSNLNQAVSSGAYQMAQGVLDTMLTTVVPLLLFATIALTVVRGFISSGSVQFELGPIFRVMFLYIGLLSYNVLVPQVGNLIGGVAELIKPTQASTSAYNVLKQLRDQANPPLGGGPTNNPGNTGAGTQDGTSILSGLGSSITTAFTSLQDALSPQKFLMGLATDFMTSIIQAIMEFIQSFLLAFLYVSGPIAIAFSFIPGFGGVAKSWLQSLIGIHMWSIAFQVIAGLFMYYTAHEAALTHTSTAAQLANLTGIAQTKYAVACIVFILMYIIVPYMSSLIVGSSAADSFVSSAMRVGASVASGGAAAAPMAAGAASSAAGAVSGAVSSGKMAAGAASSAGATPAGQALAFARGAFGGGGGGGSSSGGGSGQAAPQMAGAATESAQTSAVRSAITPQGATPSRSITSSPQYAPSGGSAVSAQNVASSAGPNGGQTTGAAAAAQTAPTMNASTATPAVASVQQAVVNSGTAAAGGSAGGFSGGATAAMRAAASRIAIDPNQKPPTLSGSST